ncbi:MAG: hypothetical protein LBI33_13715 [Propionibacteriaceae bacterium]|jgi:hypothetical protein|nr:hypothetical protein [Propionibacteriaceae bacterium]
MGSLLLAVVFFASGATMISKARATERSTAEQTSRATTASGKKRKYFGVFMLVLGGMVTVYALLTLL